MSDAWWDDIYPEPVGPGAQTDTRPREKKHDDTDAERRTDTSVSVAAAPIEMTGTYVVPPVSSWGSGRSTDPFLTKHSAHPGLQGITPEEAEELRKHEEQIVPPVPAEPPVTREKEHEPANTPKNPEPEEEVTEEDEETGWRDRLADAKEKAGAARAKVSETTAPVKKVAASAYRAVSPQRGQSFSFLWACGASVAVSPQSFVAAWDRLIAIFGAPQWRSGPEPMEWGFFHGPGVWFRSVLEAHWNEGTQGRVVLLALVGVLPIVLAQLAEKITSPGLRKAAMWVGYGFPTVFICSASYVSFLGFHTWTEVYVTALFTAAWWGFSVSRTFQPGLVQFLLRIPLASVLVGIVAYSPGAAF